MNRLLAQAINLPGINPTTGLEQPQSIEYPDSFKNFPFLSPTTKIGDIIGRAVPLVFAIAGIGLLIMIIASGFKLMTSAGDAKKMEQGRQQLTYAVVGFIVIFASFWIVQILGIITGINFGSVFK